MVNESVFTTKKPLIRMPRVVDSDLCSLLSNERSWSQMYFGDQSIWHANLNELLSSLWH
jgi:hypothetical protein